MTIVPGATMNQTFGGVSGFGGTLRRGDRSSSFDPRVSAELKNEVDSSLANTIIQQHSNINPTISP